jgi:hypothetical protein
VKGKGRTGDSVSTRRGKRAGSITGQKKEKGRRERWAEMGWKSWAAGREGKRPGRERESPGRVRVFILQFFSF